MILMANLISELNNLIIKYKFRPDKSLGQNFIVNTGIIQDVLNYASLKKTDKILEIGPGTGFVSREILKVCSLTAIELDEKLIELLKQEIKNAGFKLIKGDFSKILKKKELDFNKVISFPPYYLSRELIELLCLSEAEKAVLVMQKEFAEKLISFPGSPDFVSISVLAQYFFDVELKETISKESFYPIPKSDSVIILMNRKKSKKKINDEKKFIEFVNELFRHKNKDLQSALSEVKKIMNLKEKDAELPWEKKVVLLELEDIVNVFNTLF